MTDDQPTLPGLGPDRPGDTPMLAAMRATLRALDQADQLEPRHAALAQLCLSLAQAIDGGARSGRASATAMAAAQLRETLLVLDPPPAEDPAGHDALARLDAFMAALDQAASADNVVQLPGRAG